MTETSRVKLKLVLLLLTLPIILPHPTVGPVPESVYQDRAAKEKQELAWLKSVLARTNVSQDENGNLRTKDDERMPLDMENFDPQVEDHIEEVSDQPEVTIECLRYDEQDCRHGGNCTITTTQCKGRDHLQHLGCVAIFAYPTQLITNSTDKHVPAVEPMIKKMGCLEYQERDLAECTSTDRCLQERLNTNGLAVCCCSTPLCNKESSLWLLNPDILRDKEESRHFFIPTEAPQPSSFEYLVGGSYLTLIFIVMTLIILTAIIVVCIVAHRRQAAKRKEKKKQNNITHPEHKTLIEPGLAGRWKEEDEKSFVIDIEMQPTPKELPISDWQMLSIGRFGVVSKAKWTFENGDEKYVAVKKMNESQRPSYNAEKTIFEALMEHPKWYSSIVQFVCAEKIGNELWVVTDFHDRLSLYDLLKHNVISIASCNRIIMTMVDGLSFLHDSRPFYLTDYEKKPIIHRDIKSKNILIKSDMTACIADFGLARIYDLSCENSDLLGQVGTKRYMAPEMLEGAADYNLDAFKAMDVYSMALVMWEVISRTKLSQSDEVPDYKVPYHWLGPDPLLSDVRRTVCLLKDRPEWRQEVISHDLMKQMTKTVEDMWESEGTARTTAGYVFQRVWSLIMSGVDRSEGYHSSGSAEDDDLKIFSSNDCDQRMKAYHKSSGKMPHPSPDPINNSCPPPPMIPILTPTGIIHNIDAEPSQKSAADGSVLKPMDLSDSGEKQKAPDVYYCVETNRILSESEGLVKHEEEQREKERKKALREGKKVKEEEVKKPPPSESRRSSMTPSGEF